MKRFVILLVLFAVATAFIAGLPVIKFEELKHNFGFIRQGDVVSHDYFFTNTGGEPLVITEAKVNCECTKADFPKEPVPCGGKGKVTVTFESKSAIDRQERTVELISNAQNSPVTLTFKCVVLKKKE
ncbi:MAG TPA: DUF1573 domain-containing protein [Bacteroidia bacterium]|nr:DUF1573 domain-containing protein [Bacteroidia bacterium]